MGTPPIDEAPYKSNFQPRRKIPLSFKRLPCLAARGGSGNMHLRPRTARCFRRSARTGRIGDPYLCHHNYGRERKAFCVQVDAHELALSRSGGRVITLDARRAGGCQSTHLRPEAAILRGFSTDDNDSSTDPAPQAVLPYLP